MKCHICNQDIKDTEGSVVCHTSCAELETTESRPPMLEAEGTIGRILDRAKAESKSVTWDGSEWWLLGRFKNWCWLGRLDEIKTTWQWQIVYQGDVEAAESKSEPVEVLEHNYCKMHDAVDDCDARAKRQSEPEPTEFTKKCRHPGMNPQKFGKLSWRQVLCDLAGPFIESQAEQLKRIEKGLEPVSGWFGEGKFPIEQVVVYLVADAQVDRKEVFRKTEQIKELYEYLAYWMGEGEPESEEDKEYRKLISIKNPSKDQEVKLRNLVKKITEQDDDWWKRKYFEQAEQLKELSAQVHNASLYADERNELREQLAATNKKIERLKADRKTQDELEEVIIENVRVDIERYKKIERVAGKLVQCFPEKIEGEEQRFDIPRYVIDELEKALKGE